MKAMLLAAGLGNRMLPLTRTLPKPAIPVLGRPIAAQILRRLADFGVSRAVVNLHHMPERLRSVLADGSDFGLKAIHYSQEDTILGTAGGIGNVASELRGDGDFLVHNADFLSDVDLAALLAAHRSSDCLATLVLVPSRPPYTFVEVDSSGQVVAIGGRPEPAADATAENYLFTGLHVLSDEVLDRIPPDGPSNIVTDVYLELIAERKLGAFVHDGFWWEFGDPGNYLEGSLHLLDLPPEKIASIAMTDPVRDLDEARVAVGEGADFHSGVSLVGRVAIGMAAMIGEGSTVEDSVVMPEAWVSPGSSIRRTIVGPGTELPIGCELQDVMICVDPDPEGDPPPGATREDGLLFTPLPPAPDTAGEPPR
jgi:NDP-sugar pyrophosphorylase family protein